MVRSNKGFTLVELMVVIVIIGVLTVLAVPKLTDVINKAKISEIPMVIGSWEHAQMAYVAEKGEPADGFDKIAFEDPTEDSKWFSYDDDGGGASPATITTTAKKAIGKITASTLGPRSSINDQSQVTHTFAAESDKWLKYLPSFQTEAGAGGGGGDDDD